MYVQIGQKQFKAAPIQAFYWQEAVKLGRENFC